MKCLFVLYSLIFMSSTFTLGQDYRSNLNKIIKEWGKRDGAKEIELSYDISKKMIENDSLFFEIMSEHKKAYNSWVGNLGSDVFTVYNSKDKIEDTLYIAYYEKLKQLMINVTAKYSPNSKYYEIVRLLRKKLETIKINLID